jgi:hypothetical protein
MINLPFFNNSLKFIPSLSGISEKLYLYIKKSLSEMDFLIEGTRLTPKISIHGSTIEFMGKSIPEDAYAFYEPVLNALQSYLGEPHTETLILISLEYINSSSKKILTNILKLFEKAHQVKTKISISWYYEEDDESIFDLGQDLGSIIRIPFQLIPIP